MLKRSLLLNLILALLLVVGSIVFFFNSLNWITSHGKEIQVPELVNKKLPQVIKELEDKNFTVVVDSTYKSYIDPLVILQQEPEAGNMVKIGRTIFLVVNRVEAPKMAMPDLVNKSFRNAVLILKSYRFVVGDTFYRPDIAAGAVLEQLFKGKKIAPGTMVPFGSKIDLVVGEGLADYEVDVPNLIGKTWREAKGIIQQAGLFQAVVWEGTIDDSLNAIVFKQFPEALNELDFPNAIRGGDMIDIHLMQNPSIQLLRQNAPGSLKFQDLNDSVANLIKSRLDKADTKLHKSNPAAETVPDNGVVGAERRPASTNGLTDKTDKPGNKSGTTNKKIEDKSDQDYSTDYK